MIAATIREQRLFNIALRDRHWRWARNLVAVAALTCLLGPSVERHRGSFDASFNQDFDVDTIALKLRFGFEFRVGGGSLNLVNKRLGLGKELVAVR